VLDFQVEYHTLLSEEDEENLYINKIKEKYPDVDPEEKLKSLNALDREALLDSSDYENDGYIEAMLGKIFKHQSVLEKFKVVDGMPTMSGILTTHSIAQAKRIYRRLVELKKSGELITGKPRDERRTLHDPDFPRVAITYSVAENPNDTSEAANQAAEEIKEIMADYNAMFNTSYTDVDLYNQNINNRLARKEAQYQRDGQWLDFVIVVDRLLTGFDAPTIQTLYVDRELRYQKLLQAFSRTNRTYSGKDIGMIVIFRKPKTMEANVRDAIRLFSNEDRDWEKLVPRKYDEVKNDFKSAYMDFQQAKEELAADPEDFKKRVNAIKTFQVMVNLGEAIKSYEEFEDDFAELTSVVETIVENVGHIENEKAAVKEYLEGLDGDGIGDDEINDLLQIDFSSDQRATHEEKIDSYYISQLLKDIKNEGSRQKFDEIIKNKSPIVQQAYDEALGGLDGEQEIVASVDSHFRRTIDSIVMEAAATLQVPENDLHISLNEYSKDKGEVPYINVIVEKSALTKETFEQSFNKKYRERRRTIEEYWKNIIEVKLLPLKEELVNI
jgi:type I restriction enzyme R subunit